MSGIATKSLFWRAMRLGQSATATGMATRKRQSPRLLDGIILLSRTELRSIGRAPMANGTNPYFRFYPSDFMDGVRGMTAQEVGLYTMLLCRMYEADGPIENNTFRLATYCGMREKTFSATLEKLILLGKILVTDEGLTNNRAEEEISNRARDVKNSIAAGKASAEKRQQNQRNNATTVQRPFNHTDTDTDTERTLSNDSVARAPKTDVQAIRSILCQVASEAAVDSFIAYRRKTKAKALTATAAQRLSKQLSEIMARRPRDCLDDWASDALGMAEERGWQSVQSDWYFNAKGQNNGNGNHGGKSIPQGRGNRADPALANIARLVGLDQTQGDAGFGIRGFGEEV